MDNDELIRRYFLSRLLWWKHDLEALDAEAVASLMQALEATKKDIRKRLMAEAGELADVSEWTRERLLAVDHWADEVLAGATAAITETITAASVTAATASLATCNAMLSFEGKAAAIQTVGLTPEQLKSWFQDTPLDGGVALRGWVDKAFSNGIKSELLSSLQQSGVEGKGTAEAVRRLMDKAVAVGANITQCDAITLARTYIQTANVGAQQAVYQKNKKIITKVEWCATLDNKVCARCAVLDGKIWDIDAARPAIPSHPRCRCLLLPRARSWRDFGVDIPELDKVARPWVIREPGEIGKGGKKILNAGTTKENFGGWWATLPREQQVQSIGPVRTDLIREGKLKWGDLVEKGSGRLRTLDELGYTLGGKGFYEEAKGGGLHGGFYAKHSLGTNRELEKGIKSIEKQIAFHLQCISSPESKVHDLSERNEFYQKGILIKWERDIARQSAQIHILQGILAERGKK